MKMEEPYLRPISSHAFNALVNIDDVERYSDEDMQILDSLAKVLVAHSSEGRFGISLLHKHFDLGDGEAVIERQKANPKEFTMSVGSLNCEPDLAPSMWRFATEGEEVIEVTQWFRDTEGLCIAPASSSDLPFLMELRSKMIEMNCLDRFGVGLLHRNARLAKGEVLMEGTDPGRRVQEMTVVSEVDVDRGRSIQTLWNYEEMSYNMGWVCQTWCHFDNGHRNRHKKDNRPT